MGLSGNAFTAEMPAFPPNPGDASELCGGVDFSHLPRHDLTGVSGTRTGKFGLVFRQSALNRIHAHGDATPDVEICGVLVGDVYQDDEGPFLLVEHVIEGASSQGSIGQVTFTAATWQHIQSVMDQQYPNLRMVGWYHTHPGHGVFLSEMDVFLHESFFGLPWQAALVYDPHSGKEGVFIAPNGLADPTEFVVESNEPVLQRRSEMQTTMNMPRSGKQIEPLKIRRIVRRRVLAKRVFLSILGLGLFAAAGLLLGILIREQHFELPMWIRNMVR